ncbi:MAG TPA: isocitrate lyase/phosphoenolpyruvate mutase family protein [Mycobacteriales bacterium]|nr:isocitrate lyase/phosphoenolpyruvate mutase family protein [Mycobacteriales bacterium]
MTRTLDGKAADFLRLHHGDGPLLQPNAWDVGSARILASVGFAAIATTSSGFAATLGRGDGGVSRDEALAHCRALSAEVDIPVAADLEDCFASSPDGVAETVRLAARTGLAGCSVEDFTRDRSAPIHDVSLAADRVRAAVEAAGAALVITARAENLLHGVDDLDATVARLQAYQEAGADVLFAPGIRTIEQVRAIVSSVDRPVNVLVVGGSPPVSELAAAGVARISVGGSFAFMAYASLVEAATELQRAGTVTYPPSLKDARTVFAEAFRH